MPEEKESTISSGSVARGTGVVAGLTLLSRILGFVRDLLVARLFGASAFADAFFVAFRIPNLLRSFVAEGALTSAFVPVFTTALQKGKEEAKKTLRSVATLLVLSTAAMTVIGISFSSTVVSLLAPGFKQSPDKFALCVELTQVMMPYIICISLVAMLNAALNALMIFGVSAWAQVTMNLVLIIGALIAMPMAPRGACYMLSISVVVGGIVQIITQMPRLARAELSLLPPRSPFAPAVRDLLKLMAPAIIGASIYQITVFIATIFASLLQEGSVSWLFYADRVAQLPIGIFSIALASVLLPALAKAHAVEDRGGFEKTLVDSLRYTSFVIIPLATSIFVLALPIVELLFERGAFTQLSSERTAGALQALALGLWATSCHSMIVRGFIARKDTITPTIIGLFSLSTSVLVSILCMGTPQSADGGLVARAVIAVQAALPFTFSLGHVGLALASSSAAFVSLILVSTLIHHRVSGINWGPFISATWRTLASSLAMAFAMKEALSFSIYPIAQLILASTIGVVVFVLISFILQSREMSESISIIKKRAKR